MASALKQSNVSFNLGGLTVNLGDLTSAPVVIGYALCSSLLAIVNKWAIVVFPYPSIVTALQYLTCVAVVLGLGRLKVLEHDPLTFEMMKKFFPAALVFYVAIFTNTTLFKYANVDTFIVFRSSTPLLVALADYLFRKQPWPSLSTFGALFVIFGGAVGYVLTDRDFSITAYTWACAYLITITFEMVYIKHVVSTLGLNTWGFVLYNNFWALIIFPLFWVITGEARETVSLTMDDLQLRIVIPVAISCAFGLAISFFGFASRKAISATAFTVVGVTNKLLTVIINVLVWDKHASPVGLACLLLTIVGGVMYQQSTVRPKPPPTPPADEEAATPLKEIETSADGKNHGN